jgi:hypothetical protein
MRGRLTLCLCLMILVPVSLAAQTYHFYHLAGNTGGAGTLDGNGSVARFNAPVAIVRDSAGNFFVADRGSRAIRVVSPSGTVTTLVGRWDVLGTADGPRAEAVLSGPRGITKDGADNLYIADGNRVRKVTQAGKVTTIAILPTTLNGIAWDWTTNSLFVTGSDHTVRKVTLDGVVTDFAGTAGTSGSTNSSGTSTLFLNPYGIAIDFQGRVYVSDDNHIIRIISAGVASTLAGVAGQYSHADGTPGRFYHPRGLVVDAAFNVYVADYNNTAIRRIAVGGAVSTLAGDIEGYLDETGDAAAFDGPIGLTLDGSGNVVVVEEKNHTVRRVTSSGVVTTLAGNGIRRGHLDGDESWARFNGPVGLATDLSLNLFIADQRNQRIREHDFAGVSTFSGSGDFGDADGTGTAAEFRFPTGLATDSSNNLFVTDQSNHTIRKITSAGVVSTFAGSAGQHGSTDQTGGDARFTGPFGIASDSANNLYVTETNNHTVRKVTRDRFVTTFAGQAGQSGFVNSTGNAARFSRPVGVAVDSEDNVYVADNFNYAIRKITPTRVVTTFAGGTSGSQDGTGTGARFNNPSALAFDNSDYLFVGDNNRIRRITPAGVVTSIGGHVGAGGNVEGTGTVARFGGISGMVVKPDGSILISDFSNHTIRIGRPALNVWATIDSSTGAIGTPRTLGSSSSTFSYSWRIVRKPFGSTATLSSATVRNPTFTPDAPDRYVFHLRSVSLIGQVSVTEVSLQATCPGIAVSPASIAHSLAGSPYTVTFGASGMPGPFTYSLASGDLPPGLTLSSSGTMSGTPDTPGEYSFTIEATTPLGCSGTKPYTLTVGTLAAPTGLVATWNGSAVALSWNAVPGAAGYRVFRRRQFGEAMTALADVSGTSQVDPVGTDRLYAMYVVRALDASEVQSAPSIPDLAMTANGLPDPIPGVTTISASHLVLLRAFVNGALELGGSALTPYTDSSLSGVAIKAIHLTQVRSRANSARTALGMAPVTFTDPSPAGLPAKALHFDEVWAALQ